MAVEYRMGFTVSYCVQCFRTTQVVDIGSGKGYLATTLYMQYQLSVIGIDSQIGNTHGALRRKQRLV